jgi:hypothetical protein
MSGADTPPARRFAAAVLAALLAGTPSAGAADLEWQTYVNPRFGASAEVPSDGFEADRPPDNGDGQSWTSTADGGRIVVYGANLAVASSFSEYRNWALATARSDGFDISYEAGGRSWFVYSGRRSGRIVYERVMSGCGGDVIVAVRFDYPALRRKAWDPIVRRSARSLSARASQACP